MQTRSLLIPFALSALASASFATASLAEQTAAPAHRGGFFQMNFDTIDANKDGKITADEITAQRAARIAGADADKDGKFSADELAALQMAGQQDRAARRAKAMVQRYDSDGDGLLTAAELAAGPSPMGMFARLDADSDGSITKAEAEAAQTRRHDRHGMHGMQDRMQGGMQGGMQGMQNGNGPGDCQNGN